MKQIILFISAILFSKMIPAQSSVQVEKYKTGTLLIFVKGFTSTQGQVMVALYNNAEEYRSEKPYKGVIIPVKAVEELVKFENIPYGDYVVAVIHDINENKKIDKNKLGIPTEGYGFSNNVVGKRGPPEWIKASLVFQEKNVARVINLEYRNPKIANNP